MTPTRRFPAEATSVAAARRFATGLLAELPNPTLDAVELMVSELATNCVLHAQSAFELRVASRPGQIRVEVADHASGRPTKRSPGPEEPRGRGLQIVEMFSDAWGVDHVAGNGKMVWFVVAGEPAASSA